MILRRILLAIVVLVGALVALRVLSLWRVGRIGFYAGSWIEVPADPAQGFHWPFRMYVPNVEGPLRLWLRPNNTSYGVSDDFGVHHADAAHLLETARRRADALGLVVLVPSFPRPKREWKIYTHALDRDTMLAPPPLGRLDEQLIAMMAAARAKLPNRALCTRAFIDGFSASGMFASRFAMLHPEVLEAAIVGAPGGWPMVPVAMLGSSALRYPIGTADYAAIAGREFPGEAMKRLPMLFYLGSQDTNDAVPYDDAYEEEDRIVLMGLGAKPLDRWPVAAAAFGGTRATFQVLDGVSHEIPRSLSDTIDKFLRSNDDRSHCK